MFRLAYVWSFRWYSGCDQGDRRDFFISTLTPMSFNHLLSPHLLDWPKYQVGFLPVSMSGAPVPHFLWSEPQQSWINPTLHMYAVAWGCDGLSRSSRSEGLCCMLRWMKTLMLEVIVHWEEVRFSLSLPITLSSHSSPIRSFSIQHTWNLKKKKKTLCFILRFSIRRAIGGISQLWNLTKTDGSWVTRWR